MVLSNIDWLIIAFFLLVSLVIGLVVSKKAGRDKSEFFLSGRSMPWWLLGVSMVATTFSADTPNLVADIVRTNGVSGNWIWWSFVLTGMLTVFLYAKLWRRSKVLTDLEFYELRYSGKEAAFLRGFRAVYLGFFFNVIIMATVCLAMVKLGGVLLGLNPVQSLLLVSFITLVYSLLGGLKGVILTDFFQFIVSMIGSIWATWEVIHLPQIGGLKKLLSHENVRDKLDILPDFNDSSMFLTIFIIPIAIQWWSVWYPGAEPGGGGYIAQRILSAKDEKNAVWATLFFNVVHYAFRPWPWILMALASLIVFPEVSDLMTAFPDVDPAIIKDDLSYPAMLKFLPVGLIGLVLASLISAFMSTISTHLNWGSSYLVNDLYQRFMDPHASSRKLVFVGRVMTLLLMFIAGILALFLNNALQAFNIILQIGAGTGLLFILRWFWYRINAWSEITAMITSFLIAVYFQLVHPSISTYYITPNAQLLLGVAITTASWVMVTLCTKPSAPETLINFYRLIRPGGPGWKHISQKIASEPHNALNDPSDGWDVPTGILCMLVGSIMIFSSIFTIGYLIYDNTEMFFVSAIVVVISFWALAKLWKKLKFG